MCIRDRVHRSPGGSYWRQHATAEPKLDATLQALASLNCNVGLALGTANRADQSNSFTSSLEAGDLKLIYTVTDSSESNSAKLMTVLGQLYQLGSNPDFAAVFGNVKQLGKRMRLSLPTYPFQKKRYWITEISQFMAQEQKTQEAKSVLS